MPRYKVETSMGYCGTDNTYIVEAETKDEAERIAFETLCQDVSAYCEGEATEEDIDDFDPL